MMYDCAILYGTHFTSSDVKSIIKYKELGFAKKFIVFVSKKPIGYPNEFSKKVDYLEIIVTPKFVNDAKKIFKTTKNSYIAPLDEFGFRGMERDPC
ncbi:hypothetical protein [Thermosipho affectus]|nr:hypothetical protein [Thermosipho affectus]